MDVSKLWFILGSVIFWTTEYQTTPWNVPISISKDYFILKPWWVLSRDVSDTTRSTSYLISSRTSVLSLLWHWKTQWYDWITILPTNFLWVILIVLPNSTWCSTTPGQSSISLRRCPRYYRITDIPLVYLSSNNFSVTQTAISLTRWNHFILLS